MYMYVNLRVGFAYLVTSLVVQPVSKLTTLFLSLQVGSAHFKWQKTVSLCTREDQQLQCIYTCSLEFYVQVISHAWNWKLAYTASFKVQINCATIPLKLLFSEALPGEEKYTMMMMMMVIMIKVKSCYSNWLLIGLLLHWCYLVNTLRTVHFKNIFVGKVNHIN